QDLAILAGPGLGFVGVDDQIAGPVGLFRHEGPFQPGRETRAAATAQAGSLHLVDDPVASFFKNPGSAVPMAARLRAFQRPVELAVYVGEDAILVLKHGSPHLGFLPKTRTYSASPPRARASA